MLQTLLSNRRVRVAVGLVAVAGAAVGIVVAKQAAGPRHGTPIQQAPGLAGPSRRLVHGPRPNIVFILTDDLSMNLLPFMPHIRQMQRKGLTFQNYYVSDSLCCPSRSSIFTGNFPHDTYVFSNVGSEGGFHVFYDRGEEQNTFAVALERAGYRTAMMGKYLNGYLNGSGTPANVPSTYVPPGWNEWDVGGQAYGEFNYVLNENGALRFYGNQASDYLTDVMTRQGVRFIDSAAAQRTPFFLELATFSPHDPYVPAPRDAARFPGLTAPRPASFDVLPRSAPAWLASHPPLTARQQHRINTVFRLRAQDVQSVDDMIGRIEAALAANHIAGNTYLVFSSDNGLHTGEYRLMPGKMTAFDTDIRVPLVVSGPGVRAGTTGAMVENVDLAETFAQIGGTALVGDGHSLVGLLHGQDSSDWRDAILVEHQGPDLNGVDPDFQQPASGSPRTYEAMRTRRFLYVEYDDGEREFYDLINDPFELDNLAPRLTVAELTLLHEQLIAIERCHDGTACWHAMHVALTTLSRRGPTPSSARRRRGPRR